MFDATVEAGEVCFRAAFVEEDEAIQVDPGGFLGPLLSPDFYIRTVLLAGAYRFFKRR